MNIIKRIATVAAAAVLGTAGLTACQETGYQSYCSNTLGYRVADNYCLDNTSGYGWYYVKSGRSYPSVGAKATGGSTKSPSTSVSRGGLPTSSGKVSVTKSPSKKNSPKTSKPKSSKR